MKEHEEMERSVRVAKAKKLKKWTKIKTQHKRAKLIDSSCERSQSSLTLPPEGLEVL